MIVDNKEMPFVRFIPENQLEHEVLFDTFGDDRIYLQEMLVVYNSDLHKQIIEFMEKNK